MSGNKRLIELLSELQELDDEFKGVGPRRVDRFRDWYREIRSIIERFDDGELPTKSALRSAARRTASEIHSDVERGPLTDEDLELLDPVFSRLKYADTEGALDKLEGSSDRARLAERREAALERYEKAYRRERRRIEELRASLRGVEQAEAELEEVSDPGESAGRIRDFEGKVERYNERVSCSLEAFLKRSSSEVLSTVLHANFFPETRAPRPRDREAAERLSEVEGFTVYELLDLKGYSEEKFSHLDVDEEVRRLIEENVVWLEELTGLPETGFLKLDLEDPAMAIERSRKVERYVRRMDGPVESLREVRERAKGVTSEDLKLHRIADSLDMEMEEVEDRLSEKSRQLEEELAEREGFLEGFSPPESFRTS